MDLRTRNRRTLKVDLHRIERGVGLRVPGALLTQSEYIAQL
jgi:hypothetical protein